MKNRIAIMALFLSSFSLYAQQTINIDLAMRPFSKGSYPSYQFEIPKTHLADVEKEWMKYVKTGSKNKAEMVKGEIIMPGAVNPNISPAPVNIYATLVESTSGVKLTAWFTENDSLYISTDLVDRDLAVRKYLNDFWVQQYKAEVKIELGMENEKLKKLQNELNNFIRQQEKSNKNIDEDKRSISRNEVKLETNRNDQENKQNQISQQKQTVEDQKGNPGASLDAAQKTLKEYNNDLKKLVDANEKLHREIDKWKADIREEERNIATSLSNQKLRNNDIEKQKTVIEAVQAKMDNIK